MQLHIVGCIAAYKEPLKEYCILVYSSMQEKSQGKQWLKKKIDKTHLLKIFFSLIFKVASLPPANFVEVVFFFSFTSKTCIPKYIFKLR